MNEQEIIKCGPQCLGFDCVCRNTDLPYTKTEWKLLEGTYYDGSERKIISLDRDSSFYCFCRRIR